MFAFLPLPMFSAFRPQDITVENNINFDTKGIEKGLGSISDSVDRLSKAMMHVKSTANLTAADIHGSSSIAYQYALYAIKEYDDAENALYERFRKIEPYLDRNSERRAAAKKAAKEAEQTPEKKLEDNLKRQGEKLAQAKAIYDQCEANAMDEWEAQETKWYAFKISKDTFRERHRVAEALKEYEKALETHKRMCSFYRKEYAESKVKGPKYDPFDAFYESSVRLYEIKFGNTKWDRIKRNHLKLKDPWFRKHLHEIKELAYIAEMAPNTAIGTSVERLATLLAVAKEGIEADKAGKENAA